MSQSDKEIPPLIMLGAGGHAKVLLALAEAAGLEVIGICDPAMAAQGKKDWRGIPILGADDVLDTLDPAEIGIINGIGQIVRSRQRQIIYERFSALGFKFPPLIHPCAWVADSVQLEDGVQVMAGVVIQPDSSIGKNTIINTKASIDHECKVGGHVHIAPGAILCGGVNIGDCAFIASGVTVIQNITIGNNTIVGSGVTVVKKLSSDTRILGASARIVQL